MRRITYFLVFVSATLVGTAAERITATGNLVNAQGTPIDHATVLVYSAGVKKGYNLFCPTCYVDCGKRATSDAAGNFTINGLSSDLQFNLLVARDGYATKMIEKFDPSSSAAKATLDKRLPVDNALQAVHGKIIDSAGRPVRDALVEQHGAVFPNGRMSFGPGDWIDLIAVSNEKGEFEIAHKQPLKAALLQVSPRGMASKLATVTSGDERRSITVFDGTVVRGRLLKDGKPLANMQVALSSHDHNSQSMIPEIRIGTDENGRFVITNVPAGRIFDVYAKMDSLAPLELAADAIQIATVDNGQEVDAGDIVARNGFTIRGNVRLSDSQPIKPNTKITISSSSVFDAQTTDLHEDGSFEFKGLAGGVYMIVPSVRGYQTDSGMMYQEVLVRRNIQPTIVMAPSKMP